MLKQITLLVILLVLSQSFNNQRYRNLAIQTTKVIHTQTYDFDTVFTGKINTCKFDQLGTKMLATGDDHSVYVFDLDSSQEQLVHSFGSEALFAKFSNDGQYIILGDNDGNCQVRNSNTFGLLYQEIEEGTPCSGGGFSEDSSIFYFIYDAPILELRIYQTENFELQQTLTPGTGKTYDTYIFKNNNELLTVNEDTKVILWDITNNTANLTKTYRDQVTSISLNDNESVIAVSDIQGGIYIFAIDGTDIAENLTAHTGQINRISVSPDGKYVVSVGEDDMIKLFDATDATEISGSSFTLSGDIHALDYTYKGQYVCYGSANNELRISRLNCGTNEYNEAGSCEVCDVVCKTCSGSATTCDSCPNSVDLRDLPTCQCKTHYYEVETTGLCEECDVSCKECENRPTNCIECPQSDVMDLPECTCKIGYYMDQDSVCQQCSSQCKKCSGSADTCTECVNGTDEPVCGQETAIGQFAFVNSQTNLVVLGDCAIQCLACETYNSNCISCSHDTRNLEEGCSCNIGYYFDGTEECKLCNENCYTCNGGADICLKCINGDPHRDLENACECQQDFKVNPKTQLCEFQGCAENEYVYEFKCFQCYMIKNNETCYQQRCPIGYIKNEETFECEEILFSTTMLMIFEIFGVIIVLVSIFCIIKMYQNRKQMGNDFFSNQGQNIKPMQVPNTAFQNENETREISSFQ